eukprot:TRINITY_DN49914_c0_g1_i1.p2 TRINITY_DN49914_c0_g1~~TRINITY_DN49914_c0_g1_i1.p2  ORF type:complete len:725 (+),score=267.66 TRINITY_DN49914_c0_g1_i1:94-2175(+)
MGNEQSALTEGCPVRVIDDPAKLEKRVRECDDLEWDEELYGGCCGRVGTVTAVDEDGTYSCTLEGVEDEVCFPRRALEDLRQEQPQPQIGSDGEDDAARAAALSVTPLIAPADPEGAVSQSSRGSASALRSAVHRAARRVKLADAKRHRRLSQCDDARSSAGGPDQGFHIDDSRISGQLLLLAVMAGIGGFLFGYDIGVVSGAMLLVVKEFHMRDVTHEVVVSATIAAASLAALLSRHAVALTRRGVLLTSASLFVFGAVMMAGSRNIGTLLIGRIVVGLGVGMASVVVPLYVAEVAPKQRRGALVTLNGVMIACGQVVAATVAASFASDPSGWRMDFGLSVVPALIQFVGCFWLPESPRLLVSADRCEEAARVIERLRPGCDGQGAVAEMQRTLQPPKRQSLRLLVRRHPRIALAGCGVQALQQLVGLNTILYYSATIVVRAFNRGEGPGEITYSEAAWMAAGVAAANFAAALVGMSLADRLGRRPLLLGSLAGVCLSLALLAVGFSTSFHYLAFLGQLSYVACHAPGLGCMAWTLNAEIYPADLREAGAGLASCVNWGCNLLVALTFLSVCNALGEAGAFALYAVIAAAGFVFVWVMVPETKGVGLDEVCGLFDSRGGVRAALAPVGLGDDDVPLGPRPPPLALPRTRVSETPRANGHSSAHHCPAERRPLAAGESSGEEKDDDDGGRATV